MWTTTTWDYHGQHELEDAGAQMSHGDIPNYASVLDHAEDAKIELDRYRKEGFLVDVDKETVSKEMAHGTISKLGLIIKQKPEGVKRRIILDLRRSGGNKKAKLPEKLVLPRPEGRHQHVQECLRTTTSMWSRRRLF